MSSRLFEGSWRAGVLVFVIVQRLSHVVALSMPNLIVFDLDGCLWKPELHHLARRSTEQTPFQTLTGGTRCRSHAGSVVTLFNDVPGIIEDIGQQGDTQMALSSRTDRPEWACELLGKFILPRSGRTLQEAMAGPWILDSTESKIRHFEKLSRETGIRLTDMVFFDNDPGNCKSVSRLGVTVGFCPNGLDRTIFDITLTKFPVKWGVVGLEVK